VSYILDALKKAERQRHTARVPTLGTVHVEVTGRRRAHWPWVVIGAVVALNLVVLLFLMRRSPESLLVPDTNTPVPPTSQNAAIPTPAPAKEESPSVVSPAAPGASESARPAPTPQEAERLAVPAVPPPAAPPRAETPRTASGSRGARSPRTAEAVSAPNASSAVGSEQAARAPAGNAPVPTTPAPSPAGAGAPERLRGAPPTAPPRPSGGSVVALQEMPADFQAAVPKMRLDALVYGRGDAGAMAFINGRKYVVGDTVDGGVTVERITEDGVVLIHQGRRFLLRQ